MITGIKLTVRGRVEGLDAAGFEKAAQAAEGRLPGQQGPRRRRHHPGRRAGVIRGSVPPGSDVRPRLLGPRRYVLIRARSSASVATSSAGQFAQVGLPPGAAHLRIPSRRAEPSGEGASTWARPSTGSAARSTRPRSTREETCRLTVLLSSPSRRPGRRPAGAAVLEQREQPGGGAVQVGVLLRGPPGADGPGVAQQESDLSAPAGRTPRAGRVGRRPVWGRHRPPRGPPDDERGVGGSRTPGRVGSRRGSAARWRSAGPRELQLLEQLVHPGLQRLDLRLELDDPLDAGEVDAVLLREPLHLAEQGDVPRAVAAPAARVRPG